MKYSINFKQGIDKTLLYSLEKLPTAIRTSILEFCERNYYPTINEIRIKKNSYIHFIANSKNIASDIYASAEDLDNIVISLTDGSLYAHIDTIKDGYIRVGKGVRAGISGTAIFDDNKITGIKDITSVNIRIPQKIYNASNYVYSLLEKANFNCSVLIFSSPGVGKTSILRDLIYRLGSTAKRFSVIDSRDEIITPFLENINYDAYISYPKGKAIEMSTKSMTPEIIICDEISTEEEAQAILKATHSGVRFIATTHARNYDELREKVILSPLISSGVFDYFVGVSREYGEKTYKFEKFDYKQEALLWKLLVLYSFLFLRFYAHTHMKKSLNAKLHI